MLQALALGSIACLVCGVTLWAWGWRRLCSMEVMV